MAEEAWDAVCEEVHSHRVSGEPDWKPDNWNDSFELRYESWLIQKGYKKPVVDTGILSSHIGQLGQFQDFGPFNLDFMTSISQFCVDDTSGENATTFFEMVERYKNKVPAGVEPTSVLRIPVLVKGAIAQLPKEARKDATVLVANVLRDYVEDEV